MSSALETGEEAHLALTDMGIDFSPLDADTAQLAGNRWSEYRRAGGSRSRIIADFLIGGHALRLADRLLSRDRGFFKSYFPDLPILDPTAAPA